MKSERNVKDDDITPRARMLRTMEMPTTVTVNFDPLLKSEQEN